MRIALLTDGIWPYRIGGMQKHSFYLVKYLARKGVEVHLYHLNNSGSDINKLEFFTEEERRFIRSFVFSFPEKGKWPWHYLKESLAYSKMLYEHYTKQEPVDFIYSKGYTGWFFLEQKKRAGAGLPPIGIRLHGYEIFQQSRGLKNRYWKLLYRPLIKFLNNRADYIYSYGGGVSDIIRQNIPGCEKRLIEIPAGIESEWLCERNAAISKPLRFAFLGRYDIRKGVKELSKALTNLPGHLDIEFHFIGPIPKEFKINSPKMKYHGAVGDVSKIREILRQTDVFVLPSHSEGMPNVILEAMASGCAILATDVGAVNVMVGDDNGWLIPPINALAIEDKIKEIVSLKAEIIEQKKMISVRKVKEHFLWDAVIEKEINAIKNILGK